MKKIKNVLSNIFTKSNNNEDIHREWSKQRSKAMGPSDLAEIDAIFSRSLEK
jgi:hypothetical protein